MPKDRGADYHKRRIAKDSPEIAAMVEAGQLSPAAAAVLAGIRHRYRSINVDNPVSAAIQLRQHASPDFIAQLLQNLGGSITTTPTNAKEAQPPAADNKLLADLAAMLQEFDRRVADYDEYKQKQKRYPNKYKRITAEQGLGRVIEWTRYRIQKLIGA
jgi:hypothetical protein